MTDIITTALLSLGLIFFFGVSVGLLRFPDFYTRSHAAAKGDTLSTTLLLLGLILYHFFNMELSWGSVSLCIKIFCILLFVSITSPTSSHALIDAGYESGLEPWTRDKGEDR